jgi:2-polyprenyl-3-methyl-5-hydroxy-6-metoxy-1,4-benzoquinol methylase
VQTGVLDSSKIAAAAELASNHGKRIGILIVAYNAVTTLSSVLRRIPEAVRANVEEIAIFDDASQDSTYELAVGLKAVSNETKLSVLRQPKNLGYGGNQKAGYRYFLERGFDVVALLHGDGQYAPEALASLYHPLVTGQADAVFGSRMMGEFGGPLKGGMPLYKYTGNRILTAFENRALGMNLTEFHSGYRAYNLHALARIDFAHMTDDFHFDTEIIIKLNHQGFRISEVPIPTYYGTEICYVNGMRYARDVVRAVHRYRQTKRSIRRHPEFQEYFVLYPVKTSSHSSHACLRQTIGTGDNVLYLGCGQGFLAAELQQAGNRIWGVDVIPAPEHRDAFEEYLQADLDDIALDLPGRLSGRLFDSVLLMDVLEHLRDPERLLAEVRRLLRPGGRLFVSVPNVANLTVRLALLFGCFEYGDRGIKDRTHLRFFTRKTALRMLRKAGFEVVRHEMTVMPLEVVVGSPDRNPLIRLAHWFLILCTWLMPTLFGYQTFMICR